MSGARRSLRNVRSRPSIGSAKSLYSESSRPERGAQREAVERRRQQLDLESRDLGRRGVEHDGLLAGADRRLLAQLLLLVVVLHEVGRGIEPEAPVHPLRLHADLVVVDRLGVVGLRGRVVGVGAAAESAGTVALRVQAEEHEIGRDAVAQPRLGRELVPFLFEGIVEAAQGGELRHDRIDQAAVLLVLGVAAAERQCPGVVEGVIRLHEGCV